jgi:predicted acylesterase/phospholipase RssA
MGTDAMCRIFITGDSDDVQFRPETFLRPAFFEYMRRAASAPRLAMEWWRDMVFPRGDSRWSDAIQHFGGLVPTGLFDSAEIEHFLRDVFTRRGRSNDFRTLPAALFVIAVELDSGKVVRFGGEDWDDIPISRAVQASAALPGLYAPVEVRGRHFVDGALRRTMHASVVLDRGVDLMIGLNPLVPFDANREAPDGIHQRLSEGGLPWCSRRRSARCCSRACRSACSATRRPTRTSTSSSSSPTATTASCSSRTSSASRRVAAWPNWRIATPSTTCRRRAKELVPVLEAHGLSLRYDVVNDQARSIVDGLPKVPAGDRNDGAPAPGAGRGDHLISSKR